MGMADSITKVSSFLTNRTFSHDSTSLIFIGSDKKIHNISIIAEVC